MKFSDYYTREDLLAINFLTFMTSMVMLIICTIAKIAGLL